MKRLVNFRTRLREALRGIPSPWALCLGMALCGTAAVPVYAHHSYAMFDMQKVVQVQGTVKEFRFTNPHSWLVLEVKDPSGTTSESRFEANGPGYLVRFGWKRTSLNPGDSVVVSMNPLKDGSPGGNLVKVTTKDGHELDARPEPPKPADGAPKP